MKFTKGLKVKFVWEYDNDIVGGSNQEEMNAYKTKMALIDHLLKE